MIDLITKVLNILLDKSAAASKYLAAGLVIVILFAIAITYLFGFIFWDQLIEPKIDHYLVTKLNSYFEGSDGSISLRARKVEPKIPNIAEAFKTSLYDDVDAVYQVNFTFSKDDIEKLGETPPIYPIYIFANVEKHIVFAFINRRQNSFAFRFCVNDVEKSCEDRTNNMQNEDLTKRLKDNPLKAARGGVESEMLRYPANLHIIQISPKYLNWDNGPISSIEGYIMVRRATFGPAK